MCRCSPYPVGSSHCDLALQRTTTPASDSLVHQSDWAGTPIGHEQVTQMSDMCNSLAVVGVVHPAVSISPLRPATVNRTELQCRHDMTSPGCPRSTKFHTSNSEAASIANTTWMAPREDLGREGSRGNQARGLVLVIDVHSLQRQPSWSASTPNRTRNMKHVQEFSHLVCLPRPDMSRRDLMSGATRKA
eukprot:3238518-Rhodomonas_salina.1